MTITPTIATRDRSCWRCIFLGIQTPTIMRGDECFDVEVEGASVTGCCMDCFERVLEEVEAGEERP